MSGESWLLNRCHEWESWATNSGQQKLVSLFSVITFSFYLDVSVCLQWEVYSWALQSNRPFRVSPTPFSMGQHLDSTSSMTSVGETSLSSTCASAVGAHVWFPVTNSLRIHGALLFPTESPFHRLAPSSLSSLLGYEKRNSQCSPMLSGHLSHSLSLPTLAHPYPSWDHARAYCLLLLALFSLAPFHRIFQISLGKRNFVLQNLRT